MFVDYLWLPLSLSLLCRTPFCSENESGWFGWTSAKIVKIKYDDDIIYVEIKFWSGVKLCGECGTPNRWHLFVVGNIKDSGFDRKIWLTWRSGSQLLWINGGWRCILGRQCTGYRRDGSFWRMSCSPISLHFKPNISKKNEEANYFRNTSKYSAMCSQASSSWFSSSITSNISFGHWASFSAATIWTDRFFACALPRDLINRCKT